MERKLKTLFRRSGSRKRDSLDFSPEAGCKSADINARTQPQIITHHDAEREYELSPSQSTSPTQPSFTTAHSRQDFKASSSQPQHHNRSTTAPLAKSSYPNDEPTQSGGQLNIEPRNGTTAYHRPQHRSEQHPSSESFADNYVAYLPALSPDADPEDAKYITLGGDTRLISGGGNRRHNEDIADRNVEQFSPGPSDDTSKQRSIDTPAQIAPQASLPRTSLSKETAIGTIKLVREDDHVEDAAGAPYKANRASWRRPRNNQDSIDDDVPHASDQGTRGAPVEELSRLNLSNADGGLNLHDRQATEEHKKRLMADPALQGVVDLTDTVDMDQTTRYAPAVTHETVLREENEIIQEVIYREIHHYDVYHRVLPVTETEILPARHFIPNPDGEGLLEVPADRFPDSKVNENFLRWYEGERKRRIVDEPAMYTPLTAPKIIDERTTMTPEGFERKDTTIVHPPVLEDMSGYGGPVRPIHFGEKGHVVEREIQTLEDSLKHISDSQQITLKELSESLPHADGPIPSEAVPMRTSSLSYNKHRSSLQNHS